MELISSNTAPTHSANYPDSPLVSVLFGEESSKDIGMVMVTVPAGVGMPAHRHNGSDVILTPVTGSVQVTKGGESVDVSIGEALLILKDESVSLTNPHQEPAELIVAAGPAAFISMISKWPEVSKETVDLT